MHTSVTLSVAINSSIDKNRFLSAFLFVALFIFSSSFSWADSLCEPGFYGADGSADCIAAPAGSFVSLAGQTQATLCEQGSFSSVEGSTSCTLAPEGSIVADVGATMATLCLEGSYADEEGMSACVKAPPGSYIATKGAVSPLLCALGSYSNTPGSTSCTLAPIGSFVPTRGATSANFCLLGTVTRVLGASACVPAIYGQLNIEETTYTINENTPSVVITVKRTNGSDGQISVDYSLHDGSAIAVKDYIYSAGTLTFLNGETTKTTTLNVVNNSLFSSDKYFTFTLNNPQSETKAKGILGAKSKATLTITNDDAAPAAGVIGFALAKQTLQENSNNLLVDVVRTGGSSGTVSVLYSTQDITATAGQQYEAVSGILRFASGELKKTLSLRVFDKEAYETPATFLINLLNPQGGALLATASSEITIVDKKPIPSSGLIEIEQNEYTAHENDHSFVVNVNRLGGAEGEASVEVSLKGSPLVIDGASTLLQFAANETQKTFTLNLTDNQTFQGDQTFTLQLGKVTGALLGTKTSATLKLIDDEAAPAEGILRFSGDSYSFSENASTFPVTIIRSNGNLGEVSVNFSTTDGTATAGKDYLAENTPITFANGELSKTLNLVVPNNTNYSGSRSFLVELLGVSGGASLATPSTAIVTIEEDDPTPAAGILQLTNTQYTANETDKTIVITVLRIGGSTGNASIDYTFSNDTASRGQDIRDRDGTLYFSEGETTKTLVFDIVDDTAIEPIESVLITLSNPKEAILGTPTKAKLSIIDNDSTPVEPPKKKTDKKGGAISFWVLLILGVTLLRRLASNPSTFDLKIIRKIHHIRSVTCTKVT
jgi:Calx-beta domain